MSYSLSVIYRMRALTPEGSSLMIALSVSIPAENLAFGNFDI